MPNRKKQLQQLAEQINQELPSNMVRCKIRLSGSILSILLEIAIQNNNENFDYESIATRISEIIQDHSLTFIKIVQLRGRKEGEEISWSKTIKITTASLKNQYQDLTINSPCPNCENKDLIYTTPIFSLSSPRTITDRFYCRTCRSKFEQDNEYQQNKIKGQACPECNGTNISIHSTTKRSCKTCNHEWEIKEIQINRAVDIELNTSNWRIGCIMPFIVFSALFLGLCSNPETNINCEDLAQSEFERNYGKTVDSIEEIQAAEEIIKRRCGY